MRAVADMLHDHENDILLAKAIGLLLAGVFVFMAAALAALPKRIGA